MVCAVIFLPHCCYIITSFCVLNQEFSVKNPQKKTRFFAAVLAVSMLASLLPAGALAADPQGSSAASSLAAVSSSTVTEEAPDAVTSDTEVSAPDTDSTASAADLQPEDTANSDAVQEDAADPDTADEDTPQTTAPQADESEPATPVDPDGAQAMTFLQEMRFLQSEPDTSDYGKLSHPDTTWTGDAIRRDTQGWLWFHYTVPEGGLTRGTTYTLDVTGALLPTDTVDYTVNAYNGNHEVIAHGKVSRTQDGLHLTFTVADDAPDSYLLAGVDGYFWVQAKLDAGQIDNNGKQPVQITANGRVTADPEIDFALDDVGPTITTAKDKVKTDTDANTITWGIESTVSAANLPTNIAEGQYTTLTYTDTLPEGLTYKDGTAKLVDGAGLTTEGLTVTAAVNEENRTVTFTVTPVPLTAAGCKVRVEYDTTYTEESLVKNAANAPMSNGTKKYINTVATAADVPVYAKDPEGHPEYKGDRTNVTPPKDATAAAEFPLGSITKDVHTINSAGEHTLLKDGCLYWTIDVDTGVLKTPYLVDTMGAGQNLVISQEHPFTVTDDNGKELFTLMALNQVAGTPWADHNADNSFGLAKNGASYEIYLQTGHGKLHISYYTHLTGGANNTITNKVNLYDGQGIDPGIHAEKNLNLGQTFGLKEGKYNSTTQEIQWTVTLHNGGYHDTDSLSLEDTFGTNVHQELLLDREISLVVKMPGEDGAETVYTYNNTTGNFVCEDGAILATLTPKQDGGVDTGFTIEFTQDGKDKISGFQRMVLSYTTRLRDNDEPGDTKDLQAWLDKNIAVSNSLTIKANNNDKQSITVNGTVRANTPVLKKASNGYDYANQEASWTVTVNEAGMALTQPTVTDTLTLDGQTAANWWYDTSSLQVTQGGIVVDPNLYQVKYNDESRPTEMILTLPDTKAGDKPYIVTYKAKVDPAALATNSSQKITNTAVLSGGPITNTKIQKRASQTVKGGLIHKAGQADGQFGANHLYNWTLTINSNRADLASLEQNGTITIYDDLPEGMAYKTGTTQVIQQNVAANGTLTDGEKLTVVEGDPSQATDTQAVVSYDSYTRKYRLTFTKDALDKKAYKVTFATRILVPSENYSNHATIGVEEPTGTDTSDTWNGAIRYSGGFSMIVTDGDVGTVLIRKKNYKDSTYLSGVEFKLEEWDETANAWVQRATFTSGAVNTQTVGDTIYEANASISGLGYGRYRVTEIKTANESYIPDSTPREFTLSAENRIQEFDWINYTPEDGGVLVLTKTISGPADPSALDQITFTVYRQNQDGSKGDEYGSYTLADFTQNNGQWTKTLEPVPAGTYLVEETNADQQSRTLTVTTALTSADGTAVTGSSGTVQNVTVETGGRITTLAYQNDYLRTVQISKRTMTGTDELPGAKLTLTDSSNQTVESWTSGNTPKTFQLPAGSYTLTETTAPDGYDVADPIIFTIGADGIITSDALEGDSTLVMRDAPKGTIVLTKTIQGPVTREEAEGALQFQVEKMADGTKTAGLTIPRTADDFPLAALLAALALSALGFAVLYLRTRKANKKK